MVTLPTKTSNQSAIPNILAPISLGELIDKITILQIKSQHLQGNTLENVKKQLEALETTLNNLQLNIEPALIRHLKKVNLDLWQIEDAIRDQERQKNFGETFIYLARSIYQKNDQRAAIKKRSIMPTDQILRKKIRISNTRKTLKSQENSEQ